jgi:hypothetical protein
MMQHDKGRTSRAHTLLNAVDATRAYGGFEWVGFEPVIEQLSHRHGQHAQQLDHVGFAETARAFAEHGHFNQLALAAANQARRRHRVQRGQKSRELGHALGEGRPVLRVAR